MRSQPPGSALLISKFLEKEIDNCFDASGFGCQAVTETFTDAVAGVEDADNGDLSDEQPSAAQVTSVSLSEAATSGFTIFFDNGNNNNNNNNDQ
jgi:hypothetical protein